MTTVKQYIESSMTTYLSDQNRRELTASIEMLVRRAVEAETRTVEHRELGSFILARLGILRGPPG